MCLQQTASHSVLSCGATILNEDFVLTSASCFVTIKSLESFLVRVGDYNINFNDTHQDVGVMIMTAI